MGLPFERTWWIEPGKIIGGRYPGTESPSDSWAMQRKLVDAGVGLIINLQEPQELGGGGCPFPDYRVVVRKLALTAGRSMEFVRFPIPDAPPMMPARRPVTDDPPARSPAFPMRRALWGTPMRGRCADAALGLSGEEGVRF